MDLSSINSDDQQITAFTIDASNTLMLTLENGGTRQLTLPSTLASGTLDQDSQTLSLTANVLSITNGNSVNFPATTDSQTLSLSGSVLGLSNGGTVDLSSFTNTDSQTITGVVSGSDLVLKLTNTASQTINLSAFAVDTNTDTQTISGIVSGTDLMVKLSNVATNTIDLSSLTTTTTPTIVADTDGDTRITVDDGTDPDTISFTVSGTEHFKMDGYRLEVLNSSDNIAIGHQAMANTTTGTANTAVGARAMVSNTTGSKNIAFGNYALSANTTASQNVAIGESALRKNTVNDNTAIGNLALSNNTTGESNVAVGASALEGNSTGRNNTAVGYYSQIRSVNVGNNNTSLGAWTMQKNAVGSNNNTFIGYLADTTSGTLISNSTALGANAIVTSSNTIQLGSTSVTLVNTSGTVSATAFRGDGSQLTNLPFIASTVNSTTFKDSFNNIAIGTEMPSINSSNTTGLQNIAIGHLNLNKVTDGDQNVAIGHRSLQSVTTGSANTAVGNGAMGNNISGSYNVAYGHQSLVVQTGGTENTAYGTWSLRNLTNGERNTGIGSQAGFTLTTGSGNTFLGNNTGHGITTGNNNTVIGAVVQSLPQNLSNTIIVADGSGNRRIFINNNGLMGLGTTSPTVKLEVVGTVSATAFRGDGSQLTNVNAPVGEDILLLNPGQFSGGGGPSSVLGIAGTSHGRLRITAGNSDTFDDSQGASIDLHGNSASSNTGVLDLVAGSSAAATNQAIKFWTNTGFNQQVSAYITGNGNMAIGVISNPQYRLNVDGSVNITTGNSYLVNGVSGSTPDYVFESYFEGTSAYNPDYQLLSLEEIETFVKEIKHLPGVQSRAEIKAKNSWNVSENVRTNLEKVEELFLHTIAQQKEIKALKEANLKYQTELLNQQKLIQQLAKRLKALEEK